MNSEGIKLDFNHPWHEFLSMFNVPKEKHREFYEKFGYYLHSISTPENKKQAAFDWIVKNMGINLNLQD